MLHYGKDVDRATITAKYQDLFRRGLDPQGNPVPFPTFRRYMTDVLTELDEDMLAQEMIMEQFIAEAVAARAAFHAPSMSSEADAPFLAQMKSLDEAMLFDPMPFDAHQHN